MRIPLVGNPTNRDNNASKDQRYVNCFPEAVPNPISGDTVTYVTKRNGFLANNQPGGTAGTGRGIFGWNGKLYSVIGDKLYSNTTAIQTLTTSTGYVGFEVFKGAAEYLVMLDGVKGYYISTTDVVTQITDVDFPTPHLPYPVFLDSYLFVQKATGEIFNCDVGDITSWAALSFLTPESYPDLGTRIVQQSNLLMAIGEYSTEFFYDAANPVPGSPLGKNQQAILQYGSVSPLSVASNEGMTAFVASGKAGEKYIVTIEGTKDVGISTEAINRLLVAEGTQIRNCRGFFTRQKGHLMYVLSLISAARTIVYDFQTKMWHEWSWYDGATESYLPMVACTEYQDSGYWLHLSNGYTYKADAGTYRDNGNAIRTMIQTSRYDGDTAVVKFMSRLEAIADYEAGSTLDVSWSDNDYTTWSTARTLDLSGRARMHRCGSFRRRAFKLYHTSNTPLRIQYLDVDLTAGSN